MNLNCCRASPFSPDGKAWSPDDAWFAELEKKKREAYNRLDKSAYLGRFPLESEETIRTKLSPGDFAIRFQVSPRSKSTMDEIDLNASDDLPLPRVQDLREFLGLSPTASPGISPSNSLTPRTPRDIPRSEAIWISQAIQDTKLDLAIPAHRERLNDWDAKAELKTEVPISQSVPPPKFVEDPETHVKSVFVKSSEEPDEEEQEFVLLEDPDPKGQSVPTPAKPRFWRFRTRSDTSLMMAPNLPVKPQVPLQVLRGPKRLICSFAQ